MPKKTESDPAGLSPDQSSLVAKLLADPAAAALLEALLTKIK